MALEAHLLELFGAAGCDAVLHICAVDGDHEVALDARCYARAIFTRAHALYETPARYR